MSPCCAIIPPGSLRRLSTRGLSEQSNAIIVRTSAIDAELRKLRSQAAKVTIASAAFGPSSTISVSPDIDIYDCLNSGSLPGRLIEAEGGDRTADKVKDTTRAVATFYAEVFGRNSIDDAGMPILSSIHFGSKYNNAFWQGSQMIYGDGDGTNFLNFSDSAEIVCHELTHGVTQHTIHLAYTGEAGGLNESISDVFGSMFRQWRANERADQASWKIGIDILGPFAKAKGFDCLRDMSDPDAQHCLFPQKKFYLPSISRLAPHYSSGIPNLAFYRMATAIGGRSWELAGQIWYRALVELIPKPYLTMKEFANAVRLQAGKLYPLDKNAIDATEMAWASVGL